MYIINIEEMKTRLGKIKDIPTLPVIVVEINKMLADDMTGVDLLSQTLEKDQSIITKLLKLVNSSFFGVRSKVTTVHEAVVRMGINSVRNVVASVSLFDALHLDSESDLSFNIEDLWDHSVAVAITSRHLSEQSGIQDPDDCFVSGLLHDIGLILLARFFPDILSILLQHMIEENISIYDAEKSMIPVGHNRLGEMLARKWQLPQAICETLKYHHTPIKHAANPELLSVVHTADLITRRFIISSINPKKDETQPNLSCLKPYSAKKLEFLYQSAETWFPDVRESIREACDFFIKNKEALPNE